MSKRHLLASFVDLGLKGVKHTDDLESSAYLATFQTLVASTDGIIVVLVVLRSCLDETVIFMSTDYAVMADKNTRVSSILFFDNVVIERVEEIDPDRVCASVFSIQSAIYIITITPPVVLGTRAKLDRCIQESLHVARISTHVQIPRWLIASWECRRPIGHPPGWKTSKGWNSRLQERHTPFFRDHKHQLSTFQMTLQRTPQATEQESRRTQDHGDDGLSLHRIWVLDISL